MSYLRRGKGVESEDSEDGEIGRLWRLKEGRNLTREKGYLIVLNVVEIWESMKIEKLLLDLVKRGYYCFC